MKAFIITLKENAISILAAERCIKSSQFVGNSFMPQLFEATTAFNAIDQMKAFDLSWTYPEEGETYIHESTKLKLTGYRSANPLNRIACSLSHYRLWDLCVCLDEPILVLEHDAKFMHKLNIFKVCDESKEFNILGINSPLQATRKATYYYQAIQYNPDSYQKVPWVDDQNVPQGLAGNSAYILKPEGARQCKALVHKHGLWPNDAIMCKQLVTGLGVTKIAYTQVQGTRSTTTL